MNRKIITTAFVAAFLTLSAQANGPKGGPARLSRAATHLENFSESQPANAIALANKDRKSITVQSPKHLAKRLAKHRVSHGNVQGDRPFAKSA